MKALIINLAVQAVGRVLILVGVMIVAVVAAIRLS